MPETQICYLSLGTNLGNKRENLEKALLLIGQSVGVILKRSRFHETKAWGFQSENDFFNACVKVETTLSPRELLTETQRIERELGRTHKSVNGQYHDRLIDIDILTYGDITVDEEDLKIPHPLMNERDFVMVPLKEIML